MVGVAGQKSSGRSVWALAVRLVGARAARSEAVRFAASLSCLLRSRIEDECAMGGTKESPVGSRACNGRGVWWLAVWLRAVEVGARAVQRAIAVVFGGEKRREQAVQSTRRQR